MTPLRQKMIRAMDLKNLSNHTRRSYLAAVTRLAKFYQQSPEKITGTMIEDYLLHLKLAALLYPRSMTPVWPFERMGMTKGPSAPMPSVRYTFLGVL